MKWTKFWVPLVAIQLFSAAPAQAGINDNCWNSDRTHYGCSSEGGAVGVSAPLVGDTLESNPANLPVEKSPFGVEIMGSDRSSPRGRAKVGFSTVKGFDGLGFGVGAWSKGTFGAPDFDNHFLGTSLEGYYREYELKEKMIPGIRLGTTILLPNLFLPNFVRLSVGASFGFGQISGTVAPQGGAVMRIGLLGLGYSESLEQLSRDLPKNRISVATAGLSLGRVYLGYAYSVMRSELHRTFTKTATARLSLGKWVMHGGLKMQTDPRGQKDHWYRSGLLRKLGKRLSAGYEYGYYRHSHSALVQFFF